MDTDGLLLEFAGGSNFPLGMKSTRQVYVISEVLRWEDHMQGHSF